jgi:AmiR/NasT family two-component response regulator
MNSDPTRDLRQLRVLVLHPADREIDELLRHLKRIGCQTEVAWPPPAALASEIDVVFFAIAPEGPLVALPRLAEPEPVLIAIVDYESPSAIKSLLDSNAHSFISKPIRTSGILSSLVIARSLHGYQARMLAKVAKLEETLRSRREIERATRILMEMKSLDEDAAYQLIRSQATAQRLAMGTVARSIVTAHRVFDSPGDKPAPGTLRTGNDRTVLKMPARNLLNRSRR